MISNPSFAQYRRRPPDVEQRPPIPATPEAARAAEPWFRQRAIDAYRRYQAAKHAFLNARGELAVVEAVRNREYEPEPTYATGSSGAWPVGRLGRYREVSLDDWAVLP